MAIHVGHPLSHWTEVTYTAGSAGARCSLKRGRVIPTSYVAVGIVNVFRELLGVSIAIMKWKSYPRFYT